MNLAVVSGGVGRRIVVQNDSLKGRRHTMQEEEEERAS